MPRALRVVVAAEATDVSELPDAYLQCRELGHAWKYGEDTVTRTHRGKIVEFSRNLVCRNCEAEAWDRYDVRDFSRVGSRKISYPSGYLIKGQGRVPRSEARRVAFEHRHGKT